MKRLRVHVAFAALMLLCTAPAPGQAQERPSTMSDIIRNAVYDPATYAPAFVMYGATHLDWESSQIFFQHGSVEHNARYTVSGRSDDVAISRQAGNQKVVMDSAAILLRSLPQNLGERVLEHLLVRRYPNHRKFFLVAGRVGRIAGLSYLTVSASAGHFRQWRENERRARQLGYK